MRLLLVGAICVAVCVPALAQRAVKGDEAAIREVVKKYADARDHADAKATEALFTADADQLVSSGVWRKGRDEVVRGTMASSKTETGKRIIAVESIRFVAPGAAIADCRYEVTNLSGATRKMWSTFVLARGRDGWRIAAIRNMLPAPPQAH
jgi:uncharacterized protein (TIGR02246 family)